jgi:hypothetical protein
MKSLKKFTFFLVLAAELLACNSGEKKNQASDSLSVLADSNAMSGAQATFDADPTDSIAQSAYAPKSADSAIASQLKKALPVILEKQLTGIEQEGRRFVYFPYDLNDDGVEEIFVGFTGMNWCGSGGCTALLLSGDYKLLTYFTVVDFPFSILEQKTKGYKDLVVYSGGSDRLLKWTGSGYPRNPSVAPKFSNAKSDSSTKALDFLKKPYPWFNF